MLNNLKKRPIKQSTDTEPTPQEKHTYTNPAKNLNCTEFEVDNWEVSDFVVNKLVPAVGWHPFPLTELMLMSATVTRFRPKAIFDWGTHIGKSARVFYEVTEAFKIPSKIYSFDLPDDVDHVEHPHEKRGMLVAGLKRVKLFQEDGVTGALRISKENNIDSRDLLFFIDGDHSYESVKRELTTVIKNHPNAKVLLHDTFYQSAKSKYNVGPRKAINEFLASHHGYKEISTNTGLPGMTLIYRDR